MSELVKKVVEVAYASDNDENGWKLDYDFLAGIKRQLDEKYRWSCNIELEEIEAVVLILLNEFDLIEKG